MKNGHCMAAARILPPGILVRTTTMAMGTARTSVRIVVMPGEEHRVEGDLSETCLGEQAHVVVEAEHTSGLVERPVEQRLVQGWHDRCQNKYREEDDDCVLQPHLSSLAEEPSVSGGGMAPRYRAPDGRRRRRRRRHGNNNPSLDSGQLRPSRPSQRLVNAFTWSSGTCT